MKGLMQPFNANTRCPTIWTILTHTQPYIMCNMGPHHSHAAPIWNSGYVPPSVPLDDPVAIACEAVIQALLPLTPPYPVGFHTGGLPPPG